MPCWDHENFDQSTQNQDNQSLCAGEYTPDEMGAHCNNAVIMVCQLTQVL